MHRDIEATVVGISDDHGYTGYGYMPAMLIIGESPATAEGLLHTTVAPLLKQSPIDGVQPVMRDINLANRAIVRRYGKIALSVLARAASTYPSWLRTATKSSKISSMKRSG